MIKTVLEAIEKRRVGIGAVLAVCLIGVGSWLMWIDWHPPKSTVTTTVKKQVTSSGVSDTAVSSSPSSASTKTASSSSAKLSAGTIININTASAVQLDALPGIGPTYAGRIVDYRTKHGHFGTAHDIVKVQGIGEGTFSKIKDYITVKGE